MSNRLYKCLSSDYCELGEAEEELLGPNVIEADGGLRIDAATAEGDDLASTEAGMLDMLTDGQGACSRLGRGDGRGRVIGFGTDADAPHACRRSGGNARGIGGGTMTYR